MCSSDLSQVFEHSSTIQFLEHFLSAKFGKDVRQHEISTWRRAISGDLTSCFRPFTGESDRLRSMDRNVHVVDIELARSKPLPAAFDPVSAAEYRTDDGERRLLAARLWQEPGTKPSCALPYELSVQGSVSTDGTHFEIALSAGSLLFGRRSAGAPFILCLRGVIEGSRSHHGPGRGSNIWVSHYSVQAGDTLTDRLALDRFATDRFEVEVFGPNGFYRNFLGSRSTVQPTITCRPLVGSGNGLDFTIANPGARDIAVELSANDYTTWRKRLKLAAGRTATVAFPIDAKQPWYDVTISTDGGRSVVHVAGRLETGHPSISDPAMGGGRR